ncbi:hypothetical protein BDR06DRAFT_948502 [Suillus hirtellus]|nr:hypothetical protein BDR06DRAFT_948502 [Suillus hirtellus]
MLFTAVLALALSCMIALVVSSCLSRTRVYPLPLAFVRYHYWERVAIGYYYTTWLTYTAWGKTYGNIIHCYLLGIDLIIINSETIAQELLEKRSADCSTRPVIRTNELYALPVFIHFVFHPLIMQSWTGFHYWSASV